MLLINYPAGAVPENAGIDLNLNNLNEAEVEQRILSLKNKGAGIDKINAKLLKMSYKAILPQLTHFFNICVNKGIFPKKLKIGVVKPVYKKGDAHDFSNYRPISILPVLSKILELIIRDQLTDYFVEHNLFTDRQVGFRKKKSTYMPIMLIHDFVTTAWEANESAIGIFIDLKKAFDTVDHVILCKKLERYGVKNNALKIIESYLTDRTQIVNINNMSSDYRGVTVGVPQGSILGPLLFIIYINDLPLIDRNCQFFLYADDTAIFVKQKEVGSLQNVINQIMPKLSIWLSTNYLTLNISKTVFQHYSHSKSLAPITMRLDGADIEQKDCVLYLGMYLDNDMKFSSHITKTSSIISRNIGLISRIRYFVRQKHLVQLYNTLILPYINYCCFIWGTNYESRTKPILVLQKRALRVIEGVFLPSSATPIFKKFGLLKVNDIAKQ